MSFNSFSEFLAMGEHGLFVWSAYAIVFIVITINVAAPILGHRRFLRQQQQNLRREDSRTNEEGMLP